MSENYEGLSNDLYEKFVKPLLADLKAARQPSLDFNKGWEKANAGEPQGELQDDELSGWKVFMYDQLYAELADIKAKDMEQYNDLTTRTEIAEADLKEAEKLQNWYEGEILRLEKARMKHKAENKRLREALEIALEWIDTILRCANKTIDAVNELHPKEQKLPRLEKPPIESIKQVLKGKEAK